jgi:alkaline phosphatase
MEPRHISARRLVAAAIAATAISSTHADTGADHWYEAGRKAVQQAERLQPNDRRARNVILFVGDGMGISTIIAARILEGQLRGADGEGNRLSFEKFPYLAHSVTASANQQTSDSAPTATAMVAGIKTNDGAISVDPSIDRFEPSAEVTAAKSVKTILEQAEERGLATGIVSTARITHATPAVNYAHISNRDWEADNSLPEGATVKDIARQLLEFPYGDGIEVVLGGGRSYFYSNTTSDPEYPNQVGLRRDGRNLYEEWADKYRKSAYVWNKAQFDAIDPRRTKHLLGLFERSHMRYEADRADDVAGEPSLAEMTKKAIEMLQGNDRGFYLMVEGGRVDHAHHAGNAYRALTDAIALSEAVAVAKRKTSDRDTLIVVTADHSHVFTIAGYPDRGNPILGKAAIAGVAQTDALGLPYTTLGYANGPGWTGNFQRREFTSAEGYVDAPYIGGAARPDLTDVDTAGPNYLQEATVPMASETHAGEDVGIYASGPKAHLFHGTQEQNVIYHVMAEALGFDRRGPRHDHGWSKGRDQRWGRERGYSYNYGYGTGGKPR